MSKQPVFVDDVAHDPLWDSYRDIAAEDIDRVIQPFEQAGSNTARPNDGTDQLYGLEMIVSQRIH